MDVLCPINHTLWTEWVLDAHQDSVRLGFIIPVFYHKTAKPWRNGTIFEEWDSSQVVDGEAGNLHYNVD